MRSRWKLKWDGTKVRKGKKHLWKRNGMFHHLNLSNKIATIHSLFNFRCNSFVPKRWLAHVTKVTTRDMTKILLILFLNPLFITCCKLINMAWYYFYRILNSGTLITVEKKKKEKRKKIIFLPTKTLYKWHSIWIVWWNNIWI